MAWRWIRRFEEVGAADVALVGGKNASLGEMVRTLAPRGVRVPSGFAATAEGYRHFLAEAGLEAEIDRLLEGRVRGDHADLERRSQAIRKLILVSARREHPGWTGASREAAEIGQETRCSPPGPRDWMRRMPKK